MKDDEFDRFVESSLGLVTSKNKDLRTQYNIGGHDRWDLDQSTRQLMFSNDDHVSVSCTVDAIGSLSSNNWLWAWASDSLTKEMRESSKQLQELTELTGYDLFTTPSFEADVDMAWELSGMALQKLGGHGVYRCPGERSQLFLLIQTIEMDGT